MVLLSSCSYSCSCINRLISSSNFSLFSRIQSHPISSSTFYFKTLFQFSQPRSISASKIFRATPVEVEVEVEVDVENLQEEVDLDPIQSDKFMNFREKIEAYEINYDSCTPGLYTHLLCPKCNGGKFQERSLSFHVNKISTFAMWRCFRFECGWSGNVYADGWIPHNGVGPIRKVNTKEKPKLEPLGDALITYFAERMITTEILERNNVMQISTDKNVIAFTYRRNGEIVNCKYRSIINKKFWKEKGAGMILYGLDDIKDADEIIIVEGEIDKLSMEQAGLVNCVSVPDGAPQKVSTKELPSIENDSRFQYLWSAKDYWDKASCIILATDSDKPGQVLAEELARRLGKERCRLVKWPKKDESSYFKDANEVLRYLGPEALRDLIDNAELYQNLNESK